MRARVNMSSIVKRASLFRRSKLWLKNFFNVGLKLTTKKRISLSLSLSLLSPKHPSMHLLHSWLINGERERECVCMYGIWKHLWDCQKDITYVKKRVWWNMWESSVRENRRERDVMWKRERERERERVIVNACIQSLSSQKVYQR